MLKKALLGVALLALAACGQGQSAKQDEPAGPPAAAAAEATNLKAKAAAMGPAEVALLAVEQVKTAPGGPRGCDRIWDTQDMGEVPADALTGSTFAAHVGARAYAIHCDATGVTMTRDGRGQWLVFMPADSMTGVVEACQPDPRVQNVCFRGPIPRNPA